MSLKVRDLLEIDIFNDFELLAGEGGLDRPIESTEILDYEFARGAMMNRSQIFWGRSIALSSLLFAKDDPSLILDAVKHLVEYKVSCLAFKPVILEELPQEVIDFANKNDFPIFRFGEEKFFEDIIIIVKNELDRGNDALRMEVALEEILSHRMNARKDLIRFQKSLHPDFRKYMQAVFVQNADLKDERLYITIQRFAHTEGLQKKTAVCKFRNGFFIFLSQDTENIDRFKAQMMDVTTSMGMNPKELTCGFSSVGRTDNDFERLICEAFWAEQISELEGRRYLRFREIGIYRILTESIHSPEMIRYMEEYLRPLQNKKGSGSELMETARAYVLNHGDLDDTAKALFCHKNTVRYRLNKIRELLDPEASEHDFYANLSIAIRISIIHNALS